jgi:hypothetical protein
MIYKMRLYRSRYNEPVCPTFEVQADSIEEAREAAWDEYIENYGHLVRITEDDPEYVPMKDNGEHEGEQLYEFVLTDEYGKNVDLGTPVIAWENDEGSARESAWDMVEYLLYADAEDLDYLLEDFELPKIEKDER